MKTDNINITYNDTIQRLSAFYNLKRTHDVGKRSFLVHFHHESSLANAQGIHCSGFSLRIMNKKQSILDSDFISRSCWSAQ